MGRHYLDATIPGNKSSRKSESRNGVRRGTRTGRALWWFAWRNLQRYLGLGWNQLDTKVSPKQSAAASERGIPRIRSSSRPGRPLRRRNSWWERQRYVDVG